MSATSRHHPFAAVGAGRSPSPSSFLEVKPIFMEGPRSLSSPPLRKDARKMPSLIAKPAFEVARRTQNLP
jgi:hypothetical protein